MKVYVVAIGSSDGTAVFTFKTRKRAEEVFEKNLKDYTDPAWYGYEIEVDADNYGPLRHIILTGDEDEGVVTLDLWESEVN